MAGIEGFLQEMEMELSAKLNTQQELAKRQSELSIDIDDLRAMIAVGRERMNGQIRHEETTLASAEPQVRANPFKSDTIMSHCYEVVRDNVEPIHHKMVYKSVYKYRRCSPSYVLDILREQVKVFKEVEPGYYTLADT
jgi:hypothetical protein